MSGQIIFRVRHPCAVGTDTFDKEIDAFGLKAFWHLKVRDVKAAKAESALTAKTIEMDVLVIERALVMSLTELIFRHARTVFDGVDKVIGEEKRQRAENGRAIYRVQLIVQFAQRHWMTVLSQSTIDQQTR